LLKGIARDGEVELSANNKDPADSALLSKDGKPEATIPHGQVGSNFTISDRHLSVIPRGAWKLVVDQGSFAQPNSASEISGALLSGETRLCLNKRRR
jgi:hypothetical protein